MRAVAGVGTLLVATSVAVGNYFGRVMYDGVSKGFDSQSLLMWVPFAVLVSLLVLCCFVGLAACMCRKKKKWTLCARTSPKGEGGTTRGRGEIGRAGRAGRAPGAGRDN